MTVKVGDKEFILTKKNLRMRNLFSELVNLGADLSLLAEEAEGEAEDLSTDVSDQKLKGGDFLKMRRETRKRFRDLDRRRRENGKQMLEKRDLLLRTVLEKNGYEYDREFWLDEADIEDVNDIVTKLFRDPSGKKA